MIGKMSAQKPTALGTLLQAATYGLTIPTVYGTTQASVLAIWAANLRQGTCHGKKKKNKKKKSPPQYVENIDFLIGSDPIEGVLQVWENSNKYALNFVSERFTDPLPSLTSITLTDPYFYYVIAVTWEYHFTGRLLDYGSNGPVNYDIISEYPLWNLVQHGPDLLEAAASRNYPFCYKWAPSDGNVITFPFPKNEAPDPPWQSGSTGHTTVYYAQVSAAINRETPLVRACLTFEPVLGDGPEYTGDFLGTSTPLATQQILYPAYAGLGSPDIDLGSSGAIPLIKPEVMGSFKRWHPRGDADFADMIEDTIKSGMMQIGSQLGLIQRGVNLNNLPGPVQTGQRGFNGANPITYLQYYQPNTAGNQLIGICRFQGSDVPTITDDAGDAWVPILDAGSKGVFLATSAGSPAGNNVIFDNLTGGIRYCEILELDQGSTLLDNSKVFTGGSGTNISASIEVTGSPTYVLAAVFADRGYFPKPPTLWTDIFPAVANNGFNELLTFSRTVSTPGLVTFKNPYAGSAWTVVLLAFKSAQPVPYPKALGNILDRASLMNVRAQCQANGLIGSVNMSSQKDASDWLKEFYQCANAAPVWSGFHLKSIAWSEVSTVGNGQIYNSPTSTGPVANLTEDDLIGDKSTPLITVSRKAQVDSYNIEQINFFDRNADYNPSTASEPLNGAIALYGPRKEQPLDLPEIQDPSVARMINAIRANRYNLLRNTYKFTVMAKWAPLEAMDLITITDSKIGINALPVRITKVAENDKFELEMEAEPFVYGANSPTVLPVTAVAPYVPGDGGDPGSVNTPIIFEPVPRMLAQQNQAQIWCVVSAASPNYGGCSVLLSTDGGSSYTAVGAIQGNADTGVTVGDWPAANDPDTTNDLAVDLTESLGTLDTYSATDRDNFIPLCYVAGGGALNVQSGTSYSVSGSDNGSSIQFTNAGVIAVSLPSAASVGSGFALNIFRAGWVGTLSGLLTITPSGCTIDGLSSTTLPVTSAGAFYFGLRITSDGSNYYAVVLSITAIQSLLGSSVPYELMAYDIATLTFANHYTLPATGGGTNELRRGVFGAPGPAVGVGVDHPNGSRFAFLNPLGFGIFKLNVDPRWIGKTLYFKFLAINQLGQNMQDQADAVAYSYTPNGVASQQQNPNSNSYTITGGALTNPTSTTIHMAQAAATFPSNTANYNARTFTISAPSVPTTYYVTIADPAQLGDTGSTTNLTATCQSSNALVGAAGNVYIGSIVALPGSGGTVTTPGGSGSIPTIGLSVQSAIQNESYTYADDTGAANAYVVTLIPVPASYVEGLGVVFKAAHANTATSTLNVNGLGAKTIHKIGGASLASGDIAVGQIVYVKYDGTNFQMISQVPSSGAGTPFGETLSVGTSFNFTLSHTPNPASFLQVTKNGVVLQQGIGDDYTISGTSGTLAVAGLVTDIFQAFYIY